MDSGKKINGGGDDDDDDDDDDDNDNDDDCWQLTTKYDNLLETFEIRILRKIMGHLRKVIYGDQGIR
jgi:hypothetical protein